MARNRLNRSLSQQSYAQKGARLEDATQSADEAEARFVLSPRLWLLVIPSYQEYPTYAETRATRPSRVSRWLRFHEYLQDMGPKSGESNAH
jgi:hypothetical protein